MTSDSSERAAADSPEPIDPVTALQEELAADEDIIDVLEHQVSEDGRKIENYEIALASARVIGMAMGILVERIKCTPDQAFDLLRIISQREHRKLREIADDLVRTGELPVPDGIELG